MTTPRARTANVNGGRVYQVTHDGQLFTLPSVNTLKNLLSAPALEQWKVNRHIETARTSAAQADALSPEMFRKYVRSIVAADTEAMDRGNRCHEIAEAVLLGLDPPEHPETGWCATAVAEFVEQFEVELPSMPDGMVSTELTVVRVDDDGVPRWAGTSDGFVSAMVVDDWRRLLVLDWKTGSGIYPDAVLTTCGYIAATHYVDEHGATAPLPFRAEGGLIVHLTPTKWTVHPIYNVDAWACGRALESLADFWQYRQLHEPPVRPGI
jgi:hypothetical protein